MAVRYCGQAGGQCGQRRQGLRIAAMCGTMLCGQRRQGLRIAAMCGTMLLAIVIQYGLKGTRYKGRLGGI